MKHLFSILLFCLTCFAVFAKERETLNLYFNRISTTDGLSHRRVSCTIQDSDGFIWFGTDNGLNRWDGVNFKVFTHDPEDSTSLSSSMINCLALDSEGVLWIGCDQGVCIYDKDSDSFKRLSPANGRSKLVRDLRVTCIHDDNMGSIWIGTYEGLVKYDKRDNEIDYYSFTEHVSSDTGNEIRALCIQPPDILWVGTFNGLYKLNIKDNSSKHFVARKQYQNDSYNNLIDVLYMPDPLSGVIYIGTSNGLAIMHTDTETMEFYRSEFCGLANNDIHGLALYNENTLLIGTGNGLSAMDIDSKTFSRYSSSLLSDFSLPDQAIWDIYKDRQDCIWLSTDNGIAMLDKNRKQIKYERTVVDNGGELLDLFVYDIAVTTDGYWLATKTGIFHYNREMQLLGYYNSISGGLSHDVSKAILADSRGIIWAGTNDGLCYYDKDRDRFVKVETQTKDNPLKYIYELTEDSSGNIITNINSGACIISPETDTRKSVKNIDIKSIYVTDIIESGNNDIGSVRTDKYGNIWIGSHNKGLIEYNVKDSTFRYFKVVGNDPETICSDRIYCLFPDRYGSLWIGTDSGLCQLDIRTGKVTRHNQYPDLNTTILNIFSVDDNRVWLTSGNKLLVYNYATMTEEIICDLTGLFGMNFVSGNSSCTDSNGYQYIAGNGGFIHFNPSEINVDKTTAPLVFSDIDLQSETTAIGSIMHPWNPLMKDINDLKSIRLKHNMDSFTIFFSLLDYSSPLDNKYRYKLDGYDRFWQNTGGSKNYAHYSNLKPGKYTFSVTGCNPDGVWSDTYKTIDIVINTPWWATWWAYLLYTSVIITAFVTYWHFVKTRLKLQNALRLEKLEHHKTEEMNGIRTRMFENISHELKTPLSLIIGPIDELVSSCSDSRNRYQLSIIKKNCDKMLRLINQIMDIHKYENNAMPLELKIGEYISFTYQIYQYFYEEATARRIVYSFIRNSDNSLYMYFDADKIEKALFNIISNAFKYTSDGGTITVTVDIIERDSRPYAETLVSDTGDGITEEDIALIFNRFHKGTSNGHGRIQGTGIGLNLTKEYIEQHHGHIDLKSEVGKGTTFRFMIPCDLESSEISEYKIVNEDNTIDGIGQENRSDKTISIMIVDDNEDLLEFLKISLENTYSIITAHNGQEAVTAMKANLPDLIISDIMMPGMDGFELCRIVKSNIATCHIYVILLTARNSEHDREAGYACGADGFLSKPFSTNTLKTRISTLLQQREKIHNRYKHLLMVNDNKFDIESEDDKFIAAMIEIIEKNIKDPDFGIQELCEESRYSYQQIYRKIKALTGKTVNDFVRSVRLNHAAAYLRQSGARVSEIMYDVGFNSHSYFSKCFRETYGMSPREYAEKHKGSDSQSFTHRTE